MKDPFGFEMPSELELRQQEMKEKLTELHESENNPIKNYRGNYISKESIPDLFRPLVYIYWRFTTQQSRISIYIGMSNGVSRPFSPTHEHRLKFINADELEIFFCDSIEEARELEKRCIRYFNPEYNKTHSQVIPTKSIVSRKNFNLEKLKFIRKIQIKK